MQVQVQVLVLLPPSSNCPPLPLWQLQLVPAWEQQQGRRSCCRRRQSHFRAETAAAQPASTQAATLCWAWHGVGCPALRDCQHQPRSSQLMAAARWP